MALLKLDDVHAWYGPARVLHGIDLQVEEGAAIGLLGANGAGKTTTLRTISGTVQTRGAIYFDGENITRMRPEQVAQRGIAHVPEGRGTLGDLTVKENLEVGAYLRKDRKKISQDLDYLLELFPQLKARISSPASALSGGEQQMLAVSRAFMAAPGRLLLDEASLGLAPSTASDVYSAIAKLREDTGIALVVVEQNANLAFTIVESAVVLETGRIVLSGSTDELRGMDEVRRAYLGG